MSQSILLTSIRTFLYFGSVIALGLIVALVSAIEAFAEAPSTDWLVLGALTLLTGPFTVTVPGILARISVSDAFVFASVLLFGPSVATVIVAIDSLFATLWMRRENRSLMRALFNVSSASLSIWTASNLFFLLSGSPPGALGAVSTQVIPLFVLGTSYFLINSWLVAFALSFEQQTGACRLWWHNFPWLGLNYLAGVSLAALLVSQQHSLDLSTIGVIIPLLAISYLTYRTAVARLTDAQQHLAQVNDLYLSTIETLAMAVDAKDQITHGHIRRVQVYAVELAQRLGVRDASQLGAIEAAALLHDMGKLAIPEHILNKPGKLTTAEFETMKQHANIGADLLSSIKFPYPVVPIVRHHHENWDGTGYPTGIAGRDIPLGARILSVVDCFDALTSDRPYRGRLDVDQAFEIIRQRRGTMYDPLVVDTFICAYPEIAPRALRAGREARTLVPDTAPTGAMRDRLALGHIRATATESALLFAYRQEVSHTASQSDAFDVAVSYLRQLTASPTYALYHYDADNNRLICEHSRGDDQRVLLGFSIALGERVSGWSAANRLTSVSSDASLDLGGIASLFSPPLRTAISTPLESSGRLLGALTVYSPLQVGFSESQRYALERVAFFLGAHLAILPESSEAIGAPGSALVS